MNTPKRVKVSGGIYNAQVPPGAVYVGRAWPNLTQSVFANPWVVKRPGEIMIRGVWCETWAVRHHRKTGLVTDGFPDQAAARAEAIARFARHLDDNPGLKDRARTELRGRDLACWCQPGAPCHADLLIQIANEEGVN